MEENNNALPTEEPKTGKKRNYKSATQRISEMKIATANAQHPPVADALKTVGYTDESLAALQAEVAQVENLDLNQQKEYADQYTETNKVDTKRADITQTYLKHLGLARIMFRNDTEAQVKLGLQGRQKKAYAALIVPTANLGQNRKGRVVYHRTIPAVILFLVIPAGVKRAYNPRSL